MKTFFFFDFLKILIYSIIQKTNKKIKKLIKKINKKGKWKMK